MRLDRRRFLQLGAASGGTLVGAPALLTLLAACGSDGGTGSADSAGPFVLVKRWDDTANTAGSVRLPLALASPTDMALLTTGGASPSTLTGTVVDANGAQVTTFSTARHDSAISNPYWPVRVDVPAVGIYTLLVDGGDEHGVAFQVFAATDVQTPVTGAALPPFDTPTIDDPRGVNPVCTLTPNPCPFHAMTLTDALASGKHVVYMVGTPAHCQFGTCAPGLEFLVAAAPKFADRAVFVHADVYTDDTATQTAPAVSALHLGYEPVIYITDTAGTVTDRIDVIWDAPELDEVLTRNLS